MKITSVLMFGLLLTASGCGTAQRSREEFAQRDVALQRVRVGMTKAEAVRLAGEPAVAEKDRAYWRIVERNTGREATLDVSFDSRDVIRSVQLARLTPRAGGTRGSSEVYAGPGGAFRTNLDPRFDGGFRDERPLELGDRSLIVAPEDRTVN